MSAKGLIIPHSLKAWDDIKSKTSVSSDQCNHPFIINDKSRGCQVPHERTDIMRGTGSKLDRKVHWSAMMGGGREKTKETLGKNPMMAFVRVTPQPTQ